MMKMVACGLTIFICLHSNMTLTDGAPLQRSEGIKTDGVYWVSLSWRDGLGSMSV